MKEYVKPLIEEEEIEMMAKAREQAAALWKRL